MGLFGSILKGVGSLAGGSAGASLIGGGEQKKASKKAVAAQQMAAMEAAGLQDTAQAQNEAELSPYAGLGTEAITSLRGLVYGDGAGTIAATPDYDFRVGEGQRSLGTILRNQGLTESGAAMKEAVRFGQDMGKGEYQARFNRLSDLVGTGMNAAGSIANFRAGTADAKSNYRLGVGNVRAAGYLQRGDIRAGQYQTLGNMASDAAAAMAGGGFKMPGLPGSGSASSYGRGF